MAICCLLHMLKLGSFWSLPVLPPSCSDKHPPHTAAKTVRLPCPWFSYHRPLQGHQLAVLQSCVKGFSHQEPSAILSGWEQTLLWEPGSAQNGFNQVLGIAREAVFGLTPDGIHAQGGKLILTAVDKDYWIKVLAASITYVSKLWITVLSHKLQKKDLFQVS